jgi:hypothetical protein
LRITAIDAALEPPRISVISRYRSTACQPVSGATDVIVVGTPNVVDGSVRTESGVGPDDASGMVVDDTAVVTVLDGAATVERGALPDSMAGEEHAPATRARVNQMNPCRAATLT